MGAPHTDSSAEFLAKLRANLPALDQTPRLSVAYSGGLDSTVLLTALVKLELEVPVRALHVDHGLRAESPEWQAHCERYAGELAVEFETRRVHVDPADQGIEAAARQARYAALAELLEHNEVLVTAHHADDQLETALLRLFRGSGVKGLTAIAERVPLGSGYLNRPLLNFSRAELAAQARQWQLVWLDDPSNQSLRFDRNYVRHEVLPSIVRRWPAAARAAVRLAAHMRDADEILKAMASMDLAGATDPVPRGILRRLSPARQRNALRALVARQGLPLPGTAQLEELRASLAVTRADAETCVRWPGAEARVYRDRLYLLEPLEPVTPPESSLLAARWESEHAGALWLERSTGPGLPDAWVRQGLRIRFRRGGESFRPLQRAHKRPLKRWLQDEHILPWMRNRIPLLYRDEQLVAVGDLWVSDDVRHSDPPYWVVRWANHPPIR